MNAVILRNIFIGAIIPAILGTAALIYYAGNFLNAEVTQTIHTKIDAELSHNDLDRLKQLEKSLKTNHDSVAKAEQIVSDSKQYEYQDQIVNDINAYANKTGVRVTGYDFGDAFASASRSSLKLPTVKGVKSIGVTLTLSSPMNYDDYLRFVKAVEQNLTKMQVNGINVTPDEENPGKISNPSVMLIVYVR